LDWRNKERFSHRGQGERKNASNSEADRFTASASCVSFGLDGKKSCFFAVRQSSLRLAWEMKVRCQPQEERS